MLIVQIMTKDAVMNEVDSGTELDSQGEEEEEGAVKTNKDDEDKKDDWISSANEDIDFYD